MNCENTKELLSNFIDKELSADDANLVKAHLAGCSECAETLTRLKEVVKMVGAIPRLTLSPSATDRLASALAKQIKAGEKRELRKTSTWRRWFTQPALGYVAASVAVLAIAIVVWSPVSQNSAEKTLRSPAPLMETPTKEGEQDIEFGIGAPSEIKEFTKEEIDELVDKTSESANQKRSKPMLDTYGSDELKYSTAIDAGKAASIAAGGNTAQLISSTKGVFEGTSAWIVVIELDDQPGRLVAAAVAIDNGKLLYRK